MDVGADMIGMVKTKIKGFCKGYIENLTKYWPGGSYVVLKIKHVVHRYRTLIDLGCRYN